MDVEYDLGSRVREDVYKMWSDVLRLHDLLESHGKRAGFLPLIGL